MAAQRKAIWDDATWNLPPGALTDTAPDHMLLVALKAQAAALNEIAEIGVDGIMEGLEAYRTLQHIIRPPEELLSARVNEMRGEA